MVLQRVVQIAPSFSSFGSDGSARQNLCWGYLWRVSMMRGAQAFGEDQ